MYYANGALKMSLHLFIFIDEADPLKDRLEVVLRSVLFCSSVALIYFSVIQNIRPIGPPGLL